MPLEISEIGVRLAVGDPVATGDVEQEADSGHEHSGHEDAEPPALSPAQMTAIVDRCVAAVLRTLRMLESR